MSLKLEVELIPSNEAAYVLMVANDPTLGEIEKAAIIEDQIKYIIKTTRDDTTKAALKAVRKMLGLEG